MIEFMCVFKIFLSRYEWKTSLQFYNLLHWYEVAFSKNLINIPDNNLDLGILFFQAVLNIMLNRFISFLNIDFKTEIL